MAGVCRRRRDDGGGACLAHQQQASLPRATAAIKLAAAGKPAALIRRINWRRSGSISEQLLALIRHRRKSGSQPASGGESQLADTAAIAGAAWRKT